jgi:3-methylcrotonyl-CoA carboxylase beta subunit
MTKTNIEFNKNEDKLKLLVTDVKQRLEKIYKGGGDKRIAKQHAQGKLTARERVAALLDKGAPQIEIGAFAGFEMYKEQGGCPAGGVVVVLGYIKGRMTLVVANDATVKAGAWFPITGKRIYGRKKLPWKTAYPLFTW